VEIRDARRRAGATAKSLAQARPPAVAFVYAEDRKGARPAAHLAGFSRPLQVDGYSGFKNLPVEVELAFCWAHCRRRFYEAH
jgi:hypothetical protein